MRQNINKLDLVFCLHSVTSHATGLLKSNARVCELWQQVTIHLNLGPNSLKLQKHEKEPIRPKSVEFLVFLPICALRASLSVWGNS